MHEFDLFALYDLMSLKVCIDILDKWMYNNKLKHLILNTATVFFRKIIYFIPYANKFHFKLL